MTHVKGESSPSYFKAVFRSLIYPIAEGLYNDYFPMQRVLLKRKQSEKHEEAYSVSLWSDWKPPITWKSPTEEQYLEGREVWFCIGHMS